MLILKPTDLGSGKLKDDFEVLDKKRNPIRTHYYVDEGCIERNAMSWVNGC
jgi:hypothetical protein